MYTQCLCILLYLLRNKTLELDAAEFIHNPAQSVRLPLLSASHDSRGYLLAESLEVRMWSLDKQDFLGATPNGRAGNWAQRLLQEMTTWQLLAGVLWDLRDHTNMGQNVKKSSKIHALEFGKTRPYI